MDQVKLVMRQIVIHRFWVLSGCITLIGLVGWWMAVGSLLAEYDVNKGKIEGQYSAITAVRGVKNHPNEFSHRKMDEIQTMAKQQVAQAWVQQYQQQVGVLVWPQRLQRDFAEAVEKLRPAEKIPFSESYQQDIEKSLRARYRDYIQEVLPQLATIIKSNWDAKAGAGGMGGMGGMAGPAGGSGMSGFGGAMPGMGAGPGGGAPSLLGGGGAAGAGALPPQPTYVVQWNSGNQAAIVSRYDWSKQADNVPNTLQILYAQEDFWILTSLMNIIARTNEGADAPYKAAVKVIDAIDLGTYAQRSGAVTRVSGGGGGGGGMPGMPGMGGDAGGAAGGTTMVGGSAGGASSPPAGGGGGPGPGGASGGGGMMPGMMGGGMMGGTARSADPLEGRYVDVNLQPVKADTMRQALEVRTPQDALLAVVKRMPVRLQLTVDIRKLNRLLAECGNAQLPLEVRQVRINRQSGGGGSMGGGGGMMGGGMMGGGDGGGFAGKLGSGSGATTPGAGAPSLGAGPGAGDGMSAGGGMGGMGGGGGSGPLVATAESYEIKVEIFGLVYIYNPPNEKLLGALQVPETAGTPAAAPPTSTSSAAPSNPSRS